MLNALTIDVEDYYMVSAFADVVKFEDWPSFESRVEMNTLRLLELLARANVKATFFVLGWVAERHPGLIKEIHGAGHELASHGYRHQLVYDQSEKEFSANVRRSKKTIEDISGEAVTGFRAASYSITKRSLWALDVLANEGFRYDSSIFPIYHDRYGYPEFSRFPVNIACNGAHILEIPPSTIKLLGRNIPIAGGGYLRIFPLQFLEWGIRSLNTNEHQSAVIYLHPWEIDPDQPRINGRRLSVIRHNMNTHKTLPRLNRLLKNFQFAPIREVFADALASVPISASSPNLQR
ncbi:MAG: XrtA system polysaccharide deacetylase [Deltaproteobacteria bacterium]